MQQTKLYIFNSTSRAAAYGIGTYLKQLIYCLQSYAIQFSIICLHSKGSEVTITNDKGYEEISIPAVRNYNKDSHTYYSRNVAYILREFLPLDATCKYIFHLNFMGNHTLAMQLKKMFKAKVVLTVHYTNWSFSLLGDSSKLKKILSSRKSSLSEKDKLIHSDFKRDVKMINKCDKCVFIAEHRMLSFIDNTNLNIDKFSLINNGLKDFYKKGKKSDIEKLRLKYNIDNDAKIILFAGRLDTGKGIDFLIKSFIEVLKTHPNSYLFIVGDGNFNANLKNANTFWTKIIFTGRLEQQQLYELYRITDIGVVCSLHEEFGYVAIEMMMYQLPIIVSNTGGLAEIIEDNVSGLKVPVIKRKGNRIIDTKRLTEQICYLLENEERLQSVGIEARKRYLKMYELSIFKEKMLILYNELIQ